MLDEKKQKEVDSVDDKKMTVKDYIKWGFICIAGGVALLAIGVWMFSDGDTFFGIMEILGGVIALLFSLMMFTNAVTQFKETATAQQKRKTKIIAWSSLGGLLALSVAVVCIMAVLSKNTQSKSLPIIEALNGTSWNWYGDYGDKWVFHEYYIDEEDTLYNEERSLAWEVISVRDDVMKISVEGFRVTYEVFYTVENGVYTIDMLRYQHYRSSEYEYAERLKDYAVLLEELDTIRTEAFAGRNPMKMIEYIEWVKTNSEDLDISIIEYFPYQEMRTYFETNGTKLIVKNGENGYYDSIQDQFVNENYWYSPLYQQKYSGGSVGRYEYTKEYSFYGDFMVQSVSKVWFESGPNEFDDYLYFKGDHILNSTSGGVWTMTYQRFPEDKVYLLDAEEDFMIVALDDAEISIIHDHEMVTIAYE